MAMRLEYFLLFLLLGGLFSLLVVIPVAFIYGVWNYAVTAIFPSLPDLSVLVSFLIYAIGLTIYSFIKK